ncbi:MAG: nucleotidyl transferase AbiEii/AbiGii toxin family protein [Pseudomonadota bacterium]
MRGDPSTLPASMLARLRNVAREKQTDYQFVLRRYAVEGFLRGLSHPAQSDQFILKGAMPFTARLEDPFRPTQDVDLLGHGDPAVDRIAAAFRDICAIEPVKDGLALDIAALKAERIRDDQQYGGVRVRTRALLGKTRTPLQVDIGFGDAVTPGTEELEFPSLLSPEGPRLRAYPKETVVAEKFQAIVALGLANSRMKDFYDLFALSELFTFDSARLAKAVWATFERRQTAMPDDIPTGLIDDFASDPDKRRQWSAFVRRASLSVDAPALAEVIERLRFFLGFVIGDPRDRTEKTLEWRPGGPWR